MVGRIYFQDELTNGLSELQNLTTQESGAPSQCISVEP